MLQTAILSSLFIDPYVYVGQLFIECLYTVLGIRFERASQNITEGDEVIVILVADHSAELDISFVLQVIPMTASGEIN